MTYRFVPLPTDAVRALQRGGVDAHGREPERQVSDGTVGCRHCLRNIAEGEACLLVAHTPFTSIQPYAETGPLFICASICEPAEAGATTPELLGSDEYIVRGYDTDERIIYGTGVVAPLSDFPTRIEGLFNDEKIAFIDVRSAQNNCFQCRIIRA